MPGCFSSTTCLPLIGRLGRRAPHQPTSLSKIQHSPFHTLNDDVLLNVFCLYRLEVLDEYGEDGELSSNWNGQRWWYKLAQVCRWWRYLILASPSQLDLHLLCTNGVPIANMLARSPPLPLTIYYGDHGVTEEDEEGILLALRHIDRVHYIGLRLPAPKLRKLITALHEQFPILERLYIYSQTESDRSLVLPRSFQAPHLRHLGLWRAALPIRSPLLTTTVGLVTLLLGDIPPSAYFPPSYLLTRLSLMPQLEIVAIGFHSPPPNRDVDRQLLDTLIMTHITLPNLRLFAFQGVSADLEDLLTRISAPALSQLDIVLLTLAVPRVLQFKDTSETLHLAAVRLDLGIRGFVLRSDTRMVPFCLEVHCMDVSWREPSTVQSLTALRPLLSGVEKLVLSDEEHSQSLHDPVARTVWRDLFRPFTNLKTLHVQNSLVGKLSRCLKTDDGEPPLELLLNLKELGYSGGYYARAALTPFIDERQVAGHPVNLTMVDHSVFPRYAWVSQGMRGALQ